MKTLFICLLIAGAVEFVSVAQAKNQISAPNKQLQIVAMNVDTDKASAFRVSFGGAQ